MLLDATVVRSDGITREINAARGEIQQTRKCIYSVGYIALSTGLNSHACVGQ